MASITYKLSNKVNADNKSQVIVWLKASRTFQMQVQTSVFVNPKHFEVTGENGGAKIGFIKVPNRSKLNFAEVNEANEAKVHLQDFTNKVLKVLEVTPQAELTKDLIKNAVSQFPYLGLQDITLNAIKMSVEAENEPQKGFFEYAEVFVKEKKMQESRFRYFQVLLRCLHRWQEYRKANEAKDFSIELDTLTADDIQDFREYLANEHYLQKEQPRLFARLYKDYPIEIGTKHPHKEAAKRGENTIIKLIKFFKTYWLWLIVQKGATTNNPFVKVQIGSSVYGVPFYLTIEERNKLADFDLSEKPHLEVQRDIFVFQCLIGCRVSDLYELTEANISNGIIEYVPNKTKDNTEQVKPRIPLNERALSLIAKYKGKDNKNRLFPFISSQKYNDAIKEVIEVCGITRNVPVRNTLTGETEIRPIYEVASSHMARRTFIGAAYSKVQDPNIIGKMSGHVEGSKAFVRYRAIDDDILKSVINLID